MVMYDLQMLEIKMTDSFTEIQKIFDKSKINYIIEFQFYLRRSRSFNGKIYKRKFLIIKKRIKKQKERYVSALNYRKKNFPVIRLNIYFSFFKLFRYVVIY